MAERFDRIWHNARLATMRADRPDLGLEVAALPQREQEQVAGAEHEDLAGHVQLGHPAEAVAVEAAGRVEVGDGEREEADPLVRGISPAR